MSLAAGTKLGPYEIGAPLGAGGMGEVYRARDTRLDRIVAIKILPPHLSKDATLRQRFENEAKAISSLNHPHICALYDVGHQDGTDFLVMEYIEGETLATRLEKGPLPLEPLLKYGVQIADALDKAHRHGVVHRDLKPGNIMLTAAGVKLLDFGLAKAMNVSPASELTLSPTSPAASPAASHPVTAAGTVVGTFQYMSPEQVEGKDVDARSDIFSFGAVLYEMVTGRRAFQGKSQLSVASAVLEKEPEPISALQPLTPPALERAVKRCLEKDAENRWQTARDLELELKWIAEGGSQISSSPVAAATGIRKPRRGVLLWGVASLVLAAFTGLASWNLKPSPPIQAPPPTRFILTLPNSEPLALGDRTALAISPDGTQLVYVARHGSTTQLYLRSLDRFETVPIAGTEGAENPFFSPDGKRVGFFVEAKLKTVSLTGGLPTVLCTATNVARGASWGPDDNIIFTPNTASGLFKVPATGGIPEPVTTPDREKGERGHRWPEILPGGKAVIFTTGPGGNWVDRGRIAVLSLVTGKWRTLIEGGTDPRYLPPGHLLFIRSGDLFAVPFDSATLEVKGAPIAVLENISVSYGTGGADFALSRNGTLVYVHGSGSPQRSIVWVDRKGLVRTLSAPPRAYRDPRISPDGRRVAVSISSGTEDIWVYDLTRDTLTRVTFEGNNFTPVWTPDSKRIVYGSVKNGRTQISITTADGSEPEDIFTTENYRLDINSVSPDGSLLAYTDFPPITGGDVWLLPLKGDHKPWAYLNTSYDERQATFSPDGRWMAYSSNESGTGQVFVQAFPVPGSKWQISTDGGFEPVWSRNGRELFYRNGNKLMAVSILTTPGFTAARPRLLFEWGSLRNSSFGPSYDVAPDGQGFLMIKASEEESTSTQISIVLNWSKLLNKK